MKKPKHSQEHPSAKKPQPLRKRTPSAGQRPGFLVRYRRFAELLSILVLTFIVYGNSVNNEYNIDDGYVVSLDEGNPLTQKGILGIPEILTSRYNVGEGVTYGYRPLGKVTMAIEYSLWGNNPHNSHFINILLFALNCFLLLIFIQRVAGVLNYRESVVIYTALFLFIIHPIHTEVVCSIKNREEILCFTFMLAAILSYMKYRETSRWWHIPLFVVYVGLGLLAKQTAFNVVGLLLLLAAFIHLASPAEAGKISWRQTMRRVLDRRLLILLVLGLAVSYFVLSFIPGRIPFDFEGNRMESDPMNYFPASHFLGNGMQTVLFYVKKLFWPFPLLYYYGYNMLSDKGWNTLYPYLAILTILALIMYAWRVRNSRSALFPAFWVAFFVITLLPFSNFGIIFPYVTGVVGERLAYQASVGFCVLLALALFALAGQLHQRVFAGNPAVNTTRILVALLLVLAVPYMAITLSRNTQWKDKATLYQHDIPYLGQSARANFMMAGFIMNSLNENMSFQERGPAIVKARDHLYQAVAVYPGYNAAWLGLANIFSGYLGMNDSAMVVLQKIDTSDVVYYSRAQEVYGDIYYRDSTNADRAFEYYFRGMRENPKNRALYKKITGLIFKEQRYDSLMHFADIGIKNNWEEGIMNKAEAYLYLKDTAKAVVYYQQAVDRGNRQPQLLKNLAFYYQSKGMYIELNRLPK